MTCGAPPHGSPIPLGVWYLCMEMNGGSYVGYRNGLISR